MNDILQSLAASGAIQIADPNKQEIPAAPVESVAQPETPAAPEVKTEPQPPSPSPEASFLESLGKRYGTEFKSVDEFDAFIEKKKLPGDPLLQSAVEYVNKGGSIDDWYKTQRTDWSKLAESNPDEVLLHHSRLTNDGFTEDELRFELEQKFPTDPEKHPELSDAEIKRNQIAKKRAVQDAVKYLNEVKVKEATPPVARQAQEKQEKFLKSVQESADKARQLNEIKVGDFGFKVEWKDDKGRLPDRMKPVQEAIENPMSFLANLVNEDGINVERIARLAAIEANLDLIAKSYADARVAEEVKAIQKGIVNPQHRIPESPAVPVDEQVRTALALMKGQKI